MAPRRSLRSLAGLTTPPWSFGEFSERYGFDPLGYGNYLAYSAVADEWAEALAPNPASVSERGT